jgi:SAM-dependent methyltransferase
MATAAAREIAQEACPTCRAPGGDEWTLGDARLRRCPVCSTVYAQAYADPDAVFVDGYYTAGDGFGMDVLHPRFQAFLAEVCGVRADRVARHLSPGSVLDVGCGTGELLAAFAERGWRAQGVEPLAESAAVAADRGLDVVPALLADAGLAKRSYDLVVASHVLEHVPDGPAFLRELAAMAKPGGHVLIESPNWDSTLRRSAGAGWIHLRPLEHLVHFTPQTVAVAFREAGLEPVVTDAVTWPSALQLGRERLADLGRAGWADRLERLGPLAGPAERAAAGAARRWDERRGHGMVVWALARVP